MPPSKYPAMWVRCMEGKQISDILNIFGCSNTLLIQSFSTLFLFLGFLTEIKEHGRTSVVSFSNSTSSSIALLLTGTSCLLATLKRMYINTRVTEMSKY